METMAENQNRPCCYFCKADLQNIESNATNLKCEDCLRKMEAVPSGLQFQMVNEEDRRYECAICLSLIKKATELPCLHLMCQGCLEHYEKTQIELYKE